MYAPATFDEIKNILGDLDPLAFEEILVTGATTDEVAEAYAAFEAERQGEARRPMSSRVAAVYSIIEDAFEDLDEGEYLSATSAVDQNSSPGLAGTS
jgi:hypothetical protein